GTYHIAARVNRSGGPSYYFGFSGIQSGSLTTNLGNLTVTDTTPPRCSTNLTTANISSSSLTWVWDSPFTDDLDHLSVSLNGSFLTNLSAPATTFTVDDLAPASCYELTIECADAAGNVNLTRVNTTACTMPAPDTLPPGSVTNLRCTDIRPDSLTWEWDDPADTDFSHVLVYLDGVFTANVSTGTEMFVAADLLPGTRHTLGTLTIDVRGNLNTTWVNATAVTDQRGERHSSSHSGSSSVRPASATPSPTAPPVAIDERPLQPPLTLPDTPPFSPVGDHPSPLPPASSLSLITALLSLAAAILVMTILRREQ
ncbi:MAG: hypothetical protein LUO82_05115, partial [Methanomicrobiales archaeon]|nr:hypothetical protein [Methanomicrobiales archaeon]